MSDILKDSINEAKKIKKYLEESCRKEIVESITPIINNIISNLVTSDEIDNNIEKDGINSIHYDTEPQQNDNNQSEVITTTPSEPEANNKEEEINIDEIIDEYLKEYNLELNNKNATNEGTNTVNVSSKTNEYKKELKTENKNNGGKTMKIREQEELKKNLETTTDVTAQQQSVEEPVTAVTGEEAEEILDKISSDINIEPEQIETQSEPVQQKKTEEIIERIRRKIQEARRKKIRETETYVDKTYYDGKTLKDTRLEELRRKIRERRRLKEQEEMKKDNKPFETTFELKEKAKQLERKCEELESNIEEKDKVIKEMKTLNRRLYSLSRILIEHSKLNKFELKRLVNEIKNIRTDRDLRMLSENIKRRKILKEQLKSGLASKGSGVVEKRTLNEDVKRLKKIAGL